MKNKGFTLIELVAVMVVLGILGIITVVTITNSLKESENSAYDIQIDYIIRGAKTWASNNVFELPENDGESIIITLEQLKQSGFVQEDIANPKTKEQFSNDLEIKITKNNNIYTYEIVEEKNE